MKKIIFVLFAVFISVPQGHARAFAASSTAQRIDYLELHVADLEKKIAVLTQLFRAFGGGDSSLIGTGVDTDIKTEPSSISSLDMSRGNSFQITVSGLSIKNGDSSLYFNDQSSSNCDLTNKGDLIAPKFIVTGCAVIQTVYRSSDGTQIGFRIPKTYLGALVKPYPNPKAYEFVIRTGTKMSKFSVPVI